MKAKLVSRFRPTLDSNHKSGAVVLCCAFSLISCYQLLLTLSRRGRSTQSVAPKSSSPLWKTHLWETRTARQDLQLENTAEPRSYPDTSHKHIPTLVFILHLQNQTPFWTTFQYSEISCPEKSLLLYIPKSSGILTPLLAGVQSIWL